MHHRSGFERRLPSIRECYLRKRNCERHSGPPNAGENYGWEMGIFMKKRTDDDLRSCLWDWKDLGSALKEMGRHSSLQVRPIAPMEGPIDGPSVINCC